MTVAKIEVPSSGALESIDSQYPALFNWEYDRDHGDLMRLYEKSKTLQWNATTDIDWSIDVDPERDRLATPEQLDAILDFPEKLDAGMRRRLNHHQNAWMLSQFLHGEQGALLATARLVETVPWLEGKYYAAAQAADEARHVEVFHRYLSDKLGVSYPVNAHLRTLLQQIIQEPRWDMTFLGMQIMVEGLALAAFGVMRFTQPDEPLIGQITHHVMQDEARHVAFGVMALRDIYKQMSEAELRQREDFIIEATVLMRDRLLSEEIWPRLGLDPKIWVPWSLRTPFMIGFRQILFSKIVPNLKRIGLLTPRVRAKFAELQILDFEDFPDSTVDEGTAIPPALLAFFQRLTHAGVALPAITAVDPPVSH